MLRSERASNGDALANCEESNRLPPSQAISNLHHSALSPSPARSLGFELTLTREVDRLPQDPGHLLGSVKAHGVLCRHEVESPLSLPVEGGGFLERFLGAPRLPRATMASSMSVVAVAAR